MVDCMLISITFLILILMESACFFLSSTFLMIFQAPVVVPYPLLGSGCGFSSLYGTFGTHSVVPWHFCGTENANLHRYHHYLIWWGRSIHFPVHILSIPRPWRNFSLPSWYFLSMNCLTWRICLTCWFSKFSHPASYQESPWNYFGNGMLGALSFRSCSTSCLSKDPCRSVHILSCYCRPFEKMPLLLTWFWSHLDY